MPPRRGPDIGQPSMRVPWPPPTRVAYTCHQCRGLSRNGCETAETPRTRARAGVMLRLRAWPIAVLHALATGISTAGGVLLVVALRPQRARTLPFYSDASHADPERTLLALGENLACLLLPLVIAFERAQHARLLRDVPDGRGWGSCANFARANFAAALGVLACFFITANVPTIRPWIPLHQLAASGLMVGYAVQATCRARLAGPFRLAGAPPAVRIGIAGALWGALAVTWMCYAGLVATGSQWGRFRALRLALSTAMAAVVHVATLACVGLMAILARDLRYEVLVIEGVPIGSAWAHVKDLPPR